MVVRFKAVGNAPIMKQNLYKITASNRFQAVIQFLRKELGWKAGDPLVRVAHHSSLSRALILSFGRSSRTSTSRSRRHPTTQSQICTKCVTLKVTPYALFISSS